MDYQFLHYKKYKQIIESIDYINWANSVLQKADTSPSLSILAMLDEPYNIFEVEHYFHKAVQELQLNTPTYEQCVERYRLHLMEQIRQHPSQAIAYAYEIYRSYEGDLHSDEAIRWYEVSEMIDDLKYGDNAYRYTEKDIEKKINTLLEANRNLNN